jgi:hypothetical protein
MGKYIEYKYLLKIHWDGFCIFDYFFPFENIIQIKINRNKYQIRNNKHTKNIKIRHHPLEEKISDEGL